MKKIKLTIASLLLLGILLGALPVAAVTVTPPPDPPCKDVECVLDIVQKGVNIFFTFLMILAVIMLLYAGLKYLTAKGEPTELEKARKIIIWAIVGIGVALLSQAVTFIVKSFVGVPVT